MSNYEKLKNLSDKINLNVILVLDGFAQALNVVGLKDVANTIFNKTEVLEEISIEISQIAKDLNNESLDLAQKIHGAVIGTMISGAFKDHGKYTVIHGSKVCMTMQVELDPSQDLFKQIAEKYNINPGSIWYIYKGWPEQA